MPISKPTKAFLDTTIITDILLKPGPHARRARRALSQFESTQLPVYAIKELKAGPLANFAWIHNKLVLDSFPGALAALQSLSRTPQRYKTSTAIQALQRAAEAEDKSDLASLTKKYGEKAHVNEVLRDRWRLSLKTAVLKAWRLRRRIASETVHPLECYREVAPLEKRGLIDLKPKKCEPANECCLAGQLKAKPDHLRALKDATDKQPKRPELARRARALRSLIRTPKRQMTHDTCRHLGDAIFAFFCPEHAVILTTNVRDHAPLAKALGKNVVSPDGLE